MCSTRTRATTPPENRSRTSFGQERCHGNAPINTIHFAGHAFSVAMGNAFTKQCQLVSAWVPERHAVGSHPQQRDKRAGMGIDENILECKCLPQNEHHATSATTKPPPILSPRLSRKTGLCGA
jgi:hypothetical protein